MFGRVTKVTHADATYVETTYATVANGTTVTIRDEKGRYTEQTWQAFGDPTEARLASVKDADAKTWAYSYNALGSLTRVDAPEGPDRVWVYNEKNQVVSETQPESGTTTYTYRADGVLQTKTDALGRVTTYSYDGNHRVIGIDAPGASEDATFQYDSRDNRTRATVGAVDSIFGFDGVNRLVSREDHVGGQVFVSAFHYDARDNLTKITYPSGLAVEYEYDAADRVTRVFSGGLNYASGIGYHASGAVQSFMFGNGLQSSIPTFDARSRPARVISGPLDVTYTYDQVGNVTSTVDPRPGFSSGYDYDALDRLTSITGYGANTYTYDALGNRKTKASPGVTYYYDGSTNRLAFASSSAGAPEEGTFEYDAVGNLTRYYHLASGVDTSYTYSATNQMSSATANSVTTQYLYDADGLRIQKSSAAGQQYYVHGPGSNLLAEYASLIVKLAPTSGTSGNNQTVTLKWSGVPGATYEVCWDSTNNAVCDGSWVANQQALTRTITGLAPGTYYWQVRATTSNGTASADNGLWWSFTVTGGGFAKQGPADGLSGLQSTVTLQWAAVPDSGYWVCWDTTDNNSCDAAWWPNGGGNTRTLEGLAPATYYWQVRAQTPYGLVDADGGDWWSFTVGGGSSGFAKPAPASGLTGLSSNVLTEWTALPDEGYWFCVDTTNNNLCDGGWWPNGGASSRLLQGLAPGTYYWQVKTASTGLEADGGTWWRFTVGAPVVTFSKQTPGAGAVITANAVTLRWNAASGASFYELCVDSTNNGVCDGSWQTAAQATERTLTGLTDGTYYWQVRAQLPGGADEADAGTWWAITIDAPEPVREYIYLGDRLLAELSYSLTAPPVLTYYHTDVLGSVRAITNTSGGTVTRHDYFPFGESASPLTGDPRRFTGKELDPESGFNYFEARYYRNVWGRFTSVDPFMNSDAALLDPQRWSRYAYSLNSPLRYVDPDGRDPQQAKEVARTVAETFKGYAKELVNAAIDLANLANKAADLVISPVTDFRFGEIPRLESGSVTEGRAMLAMAVALAVPTRGESLSVRVTRVEWHHVFPQRQDLAQQFERLGIDIDRFLMPLPVALHKEIHKGGARGGRWNKAWEDFFKENPNATDQEVYRYGEKLIKDFGLGGG